MQQNKKITQAEVLSALKQVIEPSYNLNIVDLGLVRHVQISAHQIVKVAFNLIRSEQDAMWVTKMQQTLERIPGVEGVDLELITEPAWSISSMSKQGAKQLGLIFSGGSK